MILLMLRIILTWFPGADFGRPFIFLCSICDPYINWFRRFRIFKNSPLDFSPVLAIAVLALIHRVLYVWSRMGRISLGIILSMILASAWSVVSWVLGFLIIILLLRLIAYGINANIYSPFWRFIDFIAQPLIYRITHTFFPSRIVNYLARVIFSIAVLAAAFAILRIAVWFGTIFLAALPV
jgi:YggT family protein